MHAHSSDRPGKKARLAARLGVNHFIGVAPELINWAHSLLGFSAKETTLLGNSIDPAAYQALPRLDLASYFPFCPSVLGLVVANVRPVKDFDTLFRALGKSKFKDRIGVLVAGSIEDEEYVRHCHNLLSELRLREQVAFLGSRKDVPQLLASVDVGLLSSARESGPVALLEYMASALPFVVTKVGQVGKTASEGKLPGMVPEKNVTAFSAELDQLLSLSEKDRKLRGDNGQRFMLKHFSLKARIDQLQEVYASLADDWRLERGRKGK
jgi:glycosyltransferase involved in cell wall biosynthesis